jgi:hypothetical protein
VSIYVGQLPQADMARLKAELAETLIAHFCYPRFFDYRTNSLRSRPVDRAKRQEVWLYLSAYDFTAWNRVDLMSSDMQRHVERLFIQFVQRNRNFFGEQGRKRMSDIRLLIGAAATTVVQGLREHVSGRHQTGPSFGSPRPVSSWSTSNANGTSEPPWETMAPVTMLLQQQLQEVRNEISSTPTPTVPQSDPYPINTRSPGRIPTTGELEPEVVQPAISVRKTVAAAQSNGHSTSVTQNPRVATPVNISWNAAPTAPVPSVVVDPFALPLEAPVASAASTAIPTQPVQPAETKATRVSIPEKIQEPVSTPSTVVAQSVSPSSVPALSASQQTHSVSLINEEDLAIFEQLRHQVVLWLRIETIRSGLEISNQTPAQLLELLRQGEKCDETRLQVVSTLLNLANQVIKTGYASPFDYKQALMFHLMHTKR